jgi:hypothetical protein
MPSGVRFFAEHQPFTPMIDTLRGLLFGTHIGSSAVVARMVHRNRPCRPSLVDQGMAPRATRAPELTRIAGDWCRR